MKVELLTHTENPEQIIAAAARLCYSDATIEDLLDKLTPEKVDKFIDKLEKLGHQSPFEHVSYTFGIEGISRSCSHQLVRHRIASYSQKSQRYVTEDNFKYVTPESVKGIKKMPFFLQKGELEIDCPLSYDDFMALINCYYKHLIDEGVPPEDARFILPNACETSLVCTMNVRSLYNFFKLRCCNRAQWEIRDVAIEMLRICKLTSPRLFQYAGPSCLFGSCPEGKMSCGKPPIKLKDIGLIY